MTDKVSPFPRPSSSAPESLWSEGLPPSIDAPAPGSALDTLVAHMLTERDRTLAQCGDIFREWSALPSVTLEQAAWLLLQRDPWQPHPDDEAQAQALSLLHARALNRLECEVGGSLLPTGRHIPGFTRRFTMVEVLRAAQPCFLADPATTKLYGIRPITVEIFAEFLQKSELSPEQKRVITQQYVQSRVQFHRELVATLIADGLARPISATSSTRGRKRRPSAGAPVNATISGMTKAEYFGLFRRKFAEAGKAGLPGGDGPLADDCDALNIHFDRGRTKARKPPPVRRLKQRR